MNLDSLLDIRGGARIRDSLLKLPVVARQRPRAYWFRHPNFGDALSPVVLGWAINAQPVWVTKRYQGKILAIGSILQRALARQDIVWGSGLIRDEVLEPPPLVRFLAVRGPLTRSRVNAEVPEIYGDPAQLLPLFLRNVVEKRYSLGLIPHYVDQELIAVQDPAIKVIDVTEPWREVVDTIRACETVISSSLHGIIVAEAFGIPSVWIRISDRVAGGGFKFNDYFAATGRDVREPANLGNGLTAALKQVLPPPTFDLAALLQAASGIVS